MIVTSMQLTISSRRDIAVLQKESSALEGEEDVKGGTPLSCSGIVAAGYITRHTSDRLTARSSH
jgi:hypothetical protein